MKERRKNKRTELKSRIVIKKLEEGTDDEVAIDIVDVSKTGIGFACAKLLQIGEVYEAYLTIWTKEVIHSFLKIVRIELKDRGYTYGAVFIGMGEMDSARIETYQTVNENAK